ncbi:MAG TPA: hypothetical protein VF340_08135, partial [Methyloceanibacter sp.]
LALLAQQGTGAGRKRLVAPFGRAEASISGFQGAEGFERLGQPAPSLRQVKKGLLLLKCISPFCHLVA